MLFIDGHVDLIKSKFVQDQMKIRGGDLGDDQGDPTGTSTANWRLLDDYRDMLETVADGLPIKAPFVNRVTH
jgi:hypothetical protein